MSGALLWGWDDTNKVWIPLQVDANGYVKVDMSNINLDDLADVSVAAPADGYVLYWDNATSLWKCKKVEGSNLGQTFGASAGRLRNLIIAPIAGEILRMLNAGASPFSAVINGIPTATVVPYDGEVKESMFSGFASGASYWGRIIVHNTTRGNSRKVISVDTVAKEVATESSTDDWANNDVITCQSQTNAQAGYFDVDVSDSVPATMEAIYASTAFRDNESNYDIFRVVYFHPYESYNAGKRQYVTATLADENNTLVIFLKIISQKFTMCLYTGVVDIAFIMNVIGYSEYADT